MNILRIEHTVPNFEMWGNVMELFGWSEMPKATLFDVIEDKEY